MEEKQKDLPLGFQFGMFMRVFRKLVIKRFQERETGLTLEQFSVLHKMSEDKEPTITEIANQSGIDKSAVLRIINILESKHLVARMSDANDKRRKMLVLTKKGADKLEETDRFFEELVADTCNGIAPEELTAFLSTMSRLRQNAENL
jgi:DNA-binding MarR family transcriptional regulator